MKIEISLLKSQNVPLNPILCRFNSLHKIIPYIIMHLLVLSSGQCQFLTYSSFLSHLSLKFCVYPFVMFIMQTPLYGKPKLWNSSLRVIHTLWESQLSDQISSNLFPYTIRIFLQHWVIKFYTSIRQHLKLQCYILEYIHWLWHELLPHVSCFQVTVKQICLSFPRECPCLE